VEGAPQVVGVEAHPQEVEGDLVWMLAVVVVVAAAAAAAAVAGVAVA